MARAEFEPFKYIVLKCSYVEQLMVNDPIFCKNITRVLTEYRKYMTSLGKEPNNYYVVNQDESYAEDILTMILDGEEAKLRDKLAEEE